MKAHILEAVDQALAAMHFLREAESLIFIEQTAKEIISCFENGGKVLIAGNGGSLCDAMHFAEELTGFFRSKRIALPAIALADMGHMSCVANDVGFEHVFSRGVEALGKEGDILVCLTTSGNSLNLLRALEVAKIKNMKVISFLGKSGGFIKGKADLEWVVKDFKYSDRIQEAHMTALHIIVQLVEAPFLEKNFAKT